MVADQSSGADRSMGKLPRSGFERRARSTFVTSFRNPRAPEWRVKFPASVVKIAANRIDRKFDRVQAEVLEPKPWQVVARKWIVLHRAWF